MFEILPESTEVEEGSSAGGWDLALVYGIPVNETQLGFKVLPESVEVEGPRSLRVQVIDSTDSFTSPTGPLPLIIALGVPKEATTFPAYSLTPRSSGHSDSISWVVTLGFISTTTSSAAS